MGTRGRKSAAEIAVLDLDNKNKGADATGDDNKPAPPKELTKEEAAEWLAVVERLPADWFPRETWPLLTQYCRHVVASTHVAKLITAERRKPVKQRDIADLDRLLKMQEREGRAISSLATRMRLTQQSNVDPERKKPRTAQKPWKGAGAA